MHLPHRTRIMAILNVTPDSFSDGGRFDGLDDVLLAAERAVQAGADILDIGGESTRPGAKEISIEEETARVVPVIKALHRRFPEVLISIDTRKAAVAGAAVQAGAGMINDVSGLQFDPAIAGVAARAESWLVIMHSQGTPETMQANPSYSQGVIPDILAFFRQQVAVAEAAGVRRERIILDPGFGFGKTLNHNLEILGRFEAFQELGLPLLAGTSRKSFLALGNKSIGPQDREALTAASLALAIQKGASYVRVHDVESQAPAVRLLDASLNAES